MFIIMEEDAMNSDSEVSCAMSKSLTTCIDNE
jgi:hypothetical protein